MTNDYTRLKVGDVIRFAGWSGPFGDHIVIAIADGLFHLYRPHVRIELGNVVVPMAETYSVRATDRYFEILDNRG